MKTIKVVLLAGVIGLSFFFISSRPVQAAASSPAMQIVPKTKHYSRKTYRKGHYVTVTTYRNGKKQTKRVWRTSDRTGHKVARKTKHVVMGEKKPAM